ncbi:MAG: molybdenum cofactor guanylyltransferase [Cellulomonas sp.]
MNTPGSGTNGGGRVAERAGLAASLRVGVVIPAGGTARRLGGTDKPALDVGGMSILARLVAALAPLHVVVVGPLPPGPPPTRAGVVWCREEPPGGGPAAALAAGVRQFPDADVIVAVAGDQPFAATAVPRLISALMFDGTIDAALGIDSDGRQQPLLAAYRATALRGRLEGPVDGLSMRTVTAGLRVFGVPLTGPESVDVDDPADLAVARNLTTAD